VSDLRDHKKGTLAIGYGVFSKNFFGRRISGDEFHVNFFMLIILSAKLPATQTKPPMESEILM